jgi:hypothetical protein
MSRFQRSVDQLDCRLGDYFVCFGHEVLIVRPGIGLDIKRWAVDEPVCRSSIMSASALDISGTESESCLRRWTSLFTRDRG